MRSIIEIQHLTKRFDKMTAVNDLSFEIKGQEVFGLLGPNGSGKTTTLDMITGLSAPTTGSVSIKGFDPWKNARAVRALLGFVPQETALYGDLNALENLSYYYALFGRDMSKIDESINAVLELMGLQKRAKDKVKTYSGGMQRRLALARALLHDPEIIFMDEPTLGVDVQSSHVLWNYIKDMKNQGKTILVTTNYMSEADFLCDEIAIIDHGKLLAMDTPANLKASIRSDKIILEVDGTPDNLDDLKNIEPDITYQINQGEIEISLTNAAEKLQDVISVFAGHCPIKRVEMRTPTLDDVFLHFTGRKLRD